MRGHLRGGCPRTRWVKWLRSGARRGRITWARPSDPRVAKEWHEKRRTLSQPDPIAFRTSFHIHQAADEILYVISGGGTAEFGGETYYVGPGFTIFVPVGDQHKLSVSEEEPMEVLSYFDTPGFDDWFREAHERFFSRSLPMTLEDCNEIGAKYDHVCVRD